MYKVEKLDGLYCVFKSGRIIAAFTTRKAAVEAVIAYKEGKQL